MTTANDSDIQAFLSIEARHAVAVAPSFDEAVGRLAPRVAGRPRHGSQRLIVLTAATLLLVAMLAAAVAVGSGLLRPPSVIDDQEPGPMVNGVILHSDADDTYWDGVSELPPPTGDTAYHWQAFDQDTGSFLYAVDGRLWVVGQDGAVTRVGCHASADCMVTAMVDFGPDSDEVTVPSADRGAAHVLGFDGTLRETLDISAAALAPAQVLADLAWSPDGSRLAVSTHYEPERSCDEAGGRCGPTVWIFDRDGGQPQLIYTGRPPEYTLQDLAWSPDGETLALIAGPAGMLCGGPDRPRLVALRVARGEPVLSETLHIYEDDGVSGCILSRHFELAFPFAWSPDGTRIAITTAGAVAEISAEDGEVLVRHPSAGAEGPLAWLHDR